MTRYRKVTQVYFIERGGARFHLIQNTTGDGRQLFNRRIGTFNTLQEAEQAKEDKEKQQ